MTFEEKVVDILSAAYHGIHHVRIWYGREHERPNGPYEMIQVSVHDNISTWDFDTLTRLVIGCHEQAVRMEINQSGPYMLKLRFHPRQRDGGISERHPTIEEAVESYRKRSQ